MKLSPVPAWVILGLSGGVLLIGFAGIPFLGLSGYAGIAGLVLRQWVLTRLGHHVVVALTVLWLIVVPTYLILNFMGFPSIQGLSYSFVFVAFAPALMFWLGAGLRTFRLILAMLSITWAWLIGGAVGIVAFVRTSEVTGFSMWTSMTFGLAAFALIGLAPVIAVWMLVLRKKPDSADMSPNH